MEEKQIRHVELPSTDGINDLTPQDQLVYLGLRSFMNKDTLEAFPSQELVGKRIGCCDKTIRKCVKNLIDKNYLITRKEGKKIIYKFNRLKQFEPFSYEFLEDKSLSFTQKALLTSTQQYMYDKESGVGKTSYSKMELAEKINMPYSTLVKATRALEEKDILASVPTKTEFGDIKNELQFNFQKYHQELVKVLLNHEERIEETELAVKQNSMDIQYIFMRLEALEKENKRLKLQQKNLTL